MSVQPNLMLYDHDILNGMIDNTTLDGCDSAIQRLLNSPELNLKLYDALPIPIEIFAPDGLLIYINQAGLEMLNLPEANLIVGKYNLRTDPVCLAIVGLVPLGKPTVVTVKVNIK